jgi:hypothetical protein
MLLIAVAVAWAIVLGISPGVAFTAGALCLIALDHYAPRILDRVVGRG